MAATVKTSSDVSSTSDPSVTAEDGGPINIVDLKCNQYEVQNETHILYGGYEGIPEFLLINFIGWIVSY